MNKPKEFNVFFYETCITKTGKAEEMSPAQVLAHLHDVHGLERGAKAVRSMVSHIDGRDFYSSRFKWEFFPDIVLLQETQNNRGADDPMRFGG
jgi:hypothetical protein